MFRFLSRGKKKDKKTRAAEEENGKVESEKREARRKAAADRIVQNLREARADRQAQEAAEEEACQTIALSRANTDTELRKVARKQSEISDETTGIQEDHQPA